MGVHNNEYNPSTTPELLPNMENKKSERTTGPKDDFDVSFLKERTALSYNFFRHVMVPAGYEAFRRGNDGHDFTLVRNGHKKTAVRDMYYPGYVTKGAGSGKGGVEIRDDWGFLFKKKGSGNRSGSFASEDMQSMATGDFTRAETLNEMAKDQGQ